MKKVEWIDGNITTEELIIGEEVLNWNTKQLSKITNLTNNSVELYNKADVKSVYKNTSINSDGEEEVKGKIRGIGGLNWYAIDQFNRTFKKVDVLEYKFDKLKNWLNECIIKGKWNKLIY